MRDRRNDPPHSRPQAVDVDGLIVLFSAEGCTLRLHQEEICLDWDETRSLSSILAFNWMANERRESAGEPA